MGEVQEHGEGNRPLRSTDGGKGASVLCGPFNQGRSPLVVTHEVVRDDEVDGFFEGESCLFTELEEEKEVVLCESHPVQVTALAAFPFPLF